MDVESEKQGALAVREQIRYSAGGKPAEDLLAPTAGQSGILWLRRAVDRHPHR